MRVLVTGATGYIGSQLVLHLRTEGCEVAIISRQTTPQPQGVPAFLYDGNCVSVLRACEIFRPDVVFHLASMSQTMIAPGDIPAMVSANITLGTQLLEAMHLSGCRYFINTGSYWQYGPEGEVAPNSLYAACKQAFQLIIDFYVARYKLHALTLVLFDVYGPEDPRRKVVDQLIASARERCSLQATGGSQQVDFVHVSDVCRGYRHAATWLMAQPKPQHFHFALDSGVRYSLHDVAALIEKAVGEKPKVEWGALPYPPHQIFTPVRTLPRLPGWEACAHLPASIAELLPALAQEY